MAGIVIAVIAAKVAGRHFLGDAGQAGGEVRAKTVGIDFREFFLFHAVLLFFSPDAPGIIRCVL